jgi:transcriptional regulator with XRE-family HTH domain
MLEISSIDDLRKLVRSERKRRGLTQAQAAGLTGYSQKWLSDFESGRVTPPADMVLKIMNTVGIKLKAALAPDAPAKSDDDEEASL